MALAPRIKVTVQPKKTVLVNQSGLVSSRSLSSLTDVDVSSREDGSILIYDETQNKFVASRLLEKQEMNGGHF